jgi:hypothetical protein
MKCNQFEQEVDYKVQCFPKNSFTGLRRIVKVFKHKKESSNSILQGLGKGKIKVLKECLPKIGMVFG